MLEGRQKSLISRALESNDFFFFLSGFIFVSWDFPAESDGKTSAYNVEDSGSIPGLGRFPGEDNGSPLQYSCLENPMERGAS